MRYGKSPSVLFVCYAPDTSLGAQYARNAFKGLEANLPEYIQMKAVVPDRGMSPEDEVDRILGSVVRRGGVHNVIIGGWSNGGLHAIHVARGIAAADRGRMPVLLFDTCEPAYFNARGASIYNPARAALTEFYQQVLPDDEFDVYESLELIEEHRMRDHVIARIAERGIEKRMAERMLDKYQALRQRVSNSREKTSGCEFGFNGGAVLFSACRHRPDDVDRNLGWQDSFITELLELDANHFSMFRGASANTIARRVDALCEQEAWRHDE